MAKYRLPAEWEEQEMVQLTWPHEDTDWQPYLDEIVLTMVEIASAVTLHERLLIVTQNTDLLRTHLEGRLTPEQLKKVTIVECPTNDTWARDHGAITLVASPPAPAFRPLAKAPNGDGSRMFLDFTFNGWGEKFAAEKDNAINSILLPSLWGRGWGRGPLPFVLEGGSIESDGKGTVFTTSQCLLAPHRNQPLTQEEIEEKLKEYLHADRILWLNHGNLIGDDTDGHIDTIVRVCPDDTLMYVKCEDKNDEQYEDFRLLEEELKQLRTKDGKPYNLVPLPMPRPCYYDGERLPATYANFLIINGTVLVPTYNQPDLDKLACERIGQVFPDREIIPIDAQVIIRQHGSIHCLTMQFPAAEY